MKKFAVLSLLPLFVRACSFTSGAALESKDGEFENENRQSFSVNESDSESLATLDDEDYDYSEEKFPEDVIEDDFVSSNDHLFVRIEMLLREMSFEGLSPEIVNMMRFNLNALVRELADQSADAAYSASIEAVSNFIQDASVHFTINEAAYSKHFLEACLKCGIIDDVTHGLVSFSLQNSFESRIYDVEPEETTFVDSALKLIRENKLELAKRMLSAAPKDTHFFTIFNTCALEGHIEALRLLISLCSVTQLGNQIETAIITASRSQQIDVVRLLIEEINPSLRCHPSLYLNQCFLTARELGHENIVKYFNNFYFYFKRGIAASSEPHKIISNRVNTEKMVRNGINIEHLHLDGEMVIQQLVAEKKYPEVKVLIEDSLDIRIFEILCSLAKVGDFELIIFIIERLDLDSLNVVPLQMLDYYFELLTCAFNQGDLEIIKYLLEEAPVHVTHFNPNPEFDRYLNIVNPETQTELHSYLIDLQTRLPSIKTKENKH